MPGTVAVIEPRVPQRAAREGIELRAGGSLEVQVMAEPDALRRLSFTVRDERGIDYAAERMMGFDYLTAMETTELRATGRLVLRNLPAGLYVIEATSGEATATGTAAVSEGERTRIVLPF